MSLSNSTSVSIVQAVPFDQKRCTFKLPDDIYTNDLTLGNLGLYSSALDDNTGFYYPALSGCPSIIESMTLKSGATVLEHLDSFGKWCALKSLKTSNRGSEDLKRFDLLNGANLSIASRVTKGSLTYEPLNKDYRQDYYQPAVTGKPNIRFHNQFQVARKQYDQTGGLVRLSDYFESLKSWSVLPWIPELTLEIIWNAKASALYDDPDAPVTATPGSTLSVMRPVLYCTRILDAESQKKTLYKLPYLATVIEKPVVVATGAIEGIPSKVILRSKAFVDHYLKDLTLLNKVTSDDGWVLANDRSPAMRGEVIQLVLNGNYYLPHNGIDNEALKAAMFMDVHGSLNLPVSAIYEGLTDAAGRFLDRNDSNNDPSDYITANFTVGAVKIESPVQSLEVQYTREAAASAGVQRDQFTLYLIGRVARVLEVQGGVIRLSS